MVIELPLLKDMWPLIEVAGAVKLVDRLEFSRTNFTLPKGWN